MTAKRIITSRVQQILAILTLSAGLCVGNALADTIEIKGDAPQNYTVVKGDTLWDISAKYLEKPWRWPELWEGNPQIANPHLIYPGDALSLYYVDGQPHLGINRANGTVKLSPKIYSTPIDDAIPLIPIEAIGQFLRNIKVLDKATIDNAPYVVRGEEGRIIATLGDRIFVKGITDSKVKNYQVYNLGDPIKDPATGEEIAIEGIFVGDARLDKDGDPATLLLTAIKREVSVGDRLIATETDDVLKSFQPTVPTENLSGQILNIVDGVGIFGRYQAVIINLGSSDGLSRGHVLSAYTKGEVVPDTTSVKKGDTVTLPDDRAGTLMIIKAFENLSYALTMESRRAIRILDIVRTPE